MDNIVEVILPKYDTINYDKVDGFHEIESFSWGGCTNRVFTGLVEDLQVYFIQPGNGFFDIGMIYGADREDLPMMDSERFGFFSKAALEFMLQSGRQPDIIHCHDWSTAITAKSYWDDYHSYGLPHSNIVFTIHNMGYGVDLIAQAMQFSQKATTVSPTYAEEILHEGAIQHAQQKFHGIRNGIDIEIWDASDDKHLPVGYTSANVVEGKAAAKTALKQRVGLQNVDVPLIGIVSRLTLQKGVELMEHAIWTALSRGCQVVVLGSAFDKEMQQHWIDIELSLRHQYHDMARLIFAYDEPLSHLIYAGSDMLLIPSTFEPCGLTQLISMRYGTVPIVRHTGGLRDTVFDVDFDKERAAAQGVQPNGFAFEGNDTSGLDYALHRAIDCCYNRGNDEHFWNNLAKTVMEQDWSWNEPALTYMALYYAAMDR
jgi:glycogen synthase